MKTIALATGILILTMQTASANPACDVPIEAREPDPASLPEGTISASSFEHPFDGKFPVRVQVQNLAGRNLTAALEGDNKPLSIKDDGIHVFETKVECGKPYKITITDQTAGANCALTRGDAGTAGDSMEPLSINCGEASSWDKANWWEATWE